MAVMTYREALNEALREEIQRDPDVFLMGEEVAEYDGAYKVSKGLLEEFGDKRVVDSPISELGFTGLCVGASMAGLRPVVEFMTFNFAFLAIDQVINNATKMYYMSDGQFPMPIVFRGPTGAALQLSAQHSQACETYYSHAPGCKVVTPATPADGIGLFAAAVRDNDPVLFFEQKSLYGIKGEVPDGEHVDTLGTAKIVRPGDDVTVVALAAMVPRALDAAEILQSEHGISANVIDVRSLVPLDTKTILAETSRTGRLVTVEENPRLCGWGAEIVSIVAEECFYDLDGPIVRITTPHLPLPAADALEDLAMPSVTRIVDTIRTEID